MATPTRTHDIRVPIENNRSRFGRVCPILSLTRLVGQRADMAETGAAHHQLAREPEGCRFGAEGGPVVVRRGVPGWLK